MSLAKHAAALLPQHWQQELKRRHFKRQIRRNAFRTDEPEWELASEWLSPGDWAIDVGANVGHYTARFSQLVGPRGRVIAFEPVPATFELLAANMAQFALANVTLLNLAASDTTQVLGITIPSFDSGLKNYYQAALTHSPGADLHVMTCAIDILALPRRVSLVKIDAEGHDAVVLRGAHRLLERDRPVVMIETVSEEIDELMVRLDYRKEKLPNSPNVIYQQESTRKRGA